jgi:hypothetical protein
LFAGFVNETYRLQGKDVFFKNLGPCVKEGQGGYRCLGGDALVGVTQQNGRNLCKLGAARYLPFSLTVPYLTTSCTFHSDKQRHLDQGQKLVRKGFDTLENDSEWGERTSQWLPPQLDQAARRSGRPLSPRSQAPQRGVGLYCRSGAPGRQRDRAGPPHSKGLQAA